MAAKLENGTDVIARWDRASERAGEEPGAYLVRLKDLADSAKERAEILVEEYGAAPSLVEEYGAAPSEDQDPDPEE